MSLYAVKDFDNGLVLKLTSGQGGESLESLGYGGKLVIGFHLLNIFAIEKAIAPI
ncbi:hypothetical protein [Nostoc sp.]